MVMVLFLGTGLFLSPSAAWAEGGHAEAKLLVRLASGRTFIAAIDSRSNSQTLWLRFGDANALILRPISWQAIRGAEFRGQAVPLADLPRLVETEKTSQPEPTVAPGPAPQPAREAEVPRPNAAKSPATMRCEASLANWNMNNAADGLVVTISPLTADNELAVAQGTLQVEFYVPQQRDYNAASQSRGMTMERVERWTRAVCASSYTDQGATFRLPFHSLRPQLDTEYGRQGVVHITFSAPGAGIMEQTLDGVTLRPWSPLRDALQSHTGSRLLPVEQGVRGF